MPIRTLGNIRGITSAAVFEVIARAGTIAPKTDLVRITGSGAVSTITRPGRGVGPITILSTDAVAPTWDVAGNIAVAGTFTRYKLFTFIYDPTTSKWYPSATS